MCDQHVTSGEEREAEYSKQRQNILNLPKMCGSSMDAISSEP